MNGNRKLEHDWFPFPLPPGVEVGARSWLYSSFAFLHCRSRRPCPVRIGEDSGIYNGSFFELGPEGSVEIGDFCTLVGAIINTNSAVTIGSYSFIAHEVVISDGSFAAPPNLSAPAGRTAPQGKPIRIGENSWIAARSILLGGAEIGKGCIVGAGAVVDFATAPYSIVAGNPARVVGWAPPGRDA